MGGSGSNPRSEKDRLSASPSRSEQQADELRHILIVEDNAADVLLMRHAIKAVNIYAHLHIINDGEQAIRFFDQLDGDHAAPCPALVILDINLPKKQGGEVLRHIRKSRRSADSLVIAVSTSDSARDREDMTKLGANSYFRKPSEYVNFMKLGNVIKELLNSVA